MREPGYGLKREWVIIAGLVTVVAAAWGGFFVWLSARPAPNQVPLQMAGSAKTNQVPVQEARPQTSVRQPAATSLPSGPQTAAAVQSQPAGDARDTALLSALQRAERLKAEGRPRDALAELQQALQTGSAQASGPSSPQDLHNQLESLLNQLSGSGPHEQAGDRDALVTAALQALTGSAAQLGDLLHELEEDTGGRPRSSKAAPLARPHAAGEQRIVPPPGAPRPAIVAYVYGRAISRQDLGGTGEEPSDASVGRLNQRILEPLLDVYAREHGLVATTAEINSYLVSRGARPIAPAPIRPSARLPGGRSLPARPEPPKADPAVAAVVVRWQVDRSLYERYGGTVILDSFGRPEPVGAYHQFLLEQKKKVAFRIEDPAYQRRLWMYYEQDFGSRAIPPEKINFHQPWWQRSAAAP